jgi:hypothetical protein
LHVASSAKRLLGLSMTRTCLGLMTAEEPSTLNSACG